VLDRDAQVRAAVAAALNAYLVHEADTLDSAASMIGHLRPRVVVCSITFDALDLVCFARWLRATFAKTVALVMITQPGDVPQAIRAVQLGARACVELPVNGTRVRAIIAKHTA
jgi:DNA-binding NarL/FixJ family response regulator